jgi:multicomponent Na+:H+ antiporter subunit E
MSRWIHIVIARLALFALLWILLSAAYATSPLFIFLAVVTATVTSLLLWPTAPPAIRWLRLPVLALYFLRKSISGGVDVARRAFSPSMPLQPDFITYEATLGSEAARVLFTWMIGLMPGSASVNLEQDTRITIHVIDRTAYDKEGIRELESRIAAVLEPAGDDPRSRSGPNSSQGTI